MDEIAGVEVSAHGTPGGGSRTARALACAVFASVAFSVGPVITKRLIAEVPLEVLLFIFSAGAAALMALMSLAGLIDAVPSGRDPARLFRACLFLLFSHTLPMLVWISILPGVKGYFAVFVKRMQPLFVLILLHVHRRRFPSAAVVGVTLAALWGMSLLLGPGGLGGLDWYGLTAIACVMLWSVQVTFVKPVFEGLISPVQGSFLAMVMLAALTLPFAWRTALAVLPRLDGESWAWILFMTAGPYAGGMAAMYYALEVIQPWVFSMVMLVGPLFGAMLSRVLLGESMSWSQILGGAVLLVSMGASLFIRIEEPESGRSVRSPLVDGAAPGR